MLHGTGSDRTGVRHSPGAISCSQWKQSEQAGQCHQSHVNQALSSSVIFRSAPSCKAAACTRVQWLPAAASLTSTVEMHAALRVSSSRVRGMTACSHS